MKVLLTTLNAKYIHINLAIRLLYDLNHEAHPGLEWREFTIKEDKKAIAEACLAYDVVAFSCYIWNIMQTLEVCRQLKAMRPEVKILLGGPEVSYDWEDVICRPEVDFIITGEGETPFAAFLNHFPEVAAVPNLVYKLNAAGDVQVNLTAPQFDLSVLHKHQPYQYDDPETLKNKVLYIETSRGCPYKCEFCLASLDNKVRYLPTETIKEMLLYMMKNGRVIKFLDRTFNVKKAFTIEIFEFILAHYQPGNVFQFEITADILHPEIIQFIQEKVPKGLFRFEIGIQTVNQKANLEVSRKQNFEKTKSIIVQLQDKVEMHLDLIVGLALDYMPDIKYSFESVFGLFAPELQLGFLKFLKGTPVRHKHEEHGFVFDPLPPYQIIESQYLSKTELLHIERLEHALEVYWNKKRAIRTLKYVHQTYGSFDFLMDLGLYFESRQDLHKYTLKDVYLILMDFVRSRFPDDRMLRDLVALDYYQFHKLKPANLFVQEITPESWTPETKGWRAQYPKHRFVVFPIQFDLMRFEADGQIVRGDYTAIVAYDGQQTPDLVSHETPKTVVLS